MLARTPILALMILALAACGGNQASRSTFDANEGAVAGGTIGFVATGFNPIGFAGGVVGGAFLATYTDALRRSRERCHILSECVFDQPSSRIRPR